MEISLSLYSRTVERSSMSSRKSTVLSGSSSGSGSGITASSGASGFSGNQIQHILYERFNIQVEKSTFATVSTLVTIGTTAETVSSALRSTSRLVSSTA